MKYLVKHEDYEADGKGDYRLHESDGSELDSWDSRPDLDVDYHYRDLTLDNENVPW